MSDVQELVIDAIKTVKDPELPINIYDLGLIRKLDINDGVVHISMTLTTPNCPVADMMPSQVFEAVSMVDGVTNVKVELCWDPAWSVADLTKRGKSVLELMDIDINHMLAQHENKTTGLTVNKDKQE
ncbi:MAG TPA: iron-sulfur cluster assembly protein [Phycisphaerales bacterium]|jgi:metal-sulfur cluster biosynthetic enzyme|nr:iron-sulfur cluster assembly protein [Phycisphaerales bacterium]|tara:strand:- start:686 stop:1066 length:381 start_codon:yes stop_codon:yes gene_type:complete